MGMQYRTSTMAKGLFYTFWFEKNQQGDIVAVYNSSGTKVISYTYDAWGNCTTTYHNVTGTISYATYNPFSYRGYYYDSELGFYYLNSRYYDPAVGRFINADSFASTGTGILGYNMFAYCESSPVILADYGGNMWQIVHSLDPRNGCFRHLGVGSTSLGGGSYYDSSAYGTYAIRSGTALNDAYLGGYYGGSISSGITNPSSYIVPGAISVTDDMAAPLPKLDVCFVAGTLISTAEGHTEIEKIAVGDYVWATNPETGETKLKQVVQTFVNQVTELVHITVNGEEIVCTTEHPFYSPVKGWIAACKLRAGDILVMITGEHVMLEKAQHEILEAPTTVYNFEVEGFHTYFVGKHSLLVHNKCQKDVSTNVTHIKYGDNGKVYSAETYGPDGKITARIDFQGTKHYVKSVNKKVLPHVHPFENNNGYLRKMHAITLDDYLKHLGEKWHE